MRGIACGINLLLAMLLVMAVLCFAVLFVQTASAQMPILERDTVYMPYVLAHPIAQGEGPVIPGDEVQP